jgi:acetyltransferase-like isoleucine patch superfamily enzyme
MRNPLVTLTNGVIDVTGGAVGRVARVAVERGWSYFPFVSQALGQVPFSLGWKLRRAVYARLLAGVGRDSVLHHGVVLDDARTRIGDDVWVSQGVYIEYAEIGDHVLVGPHAVLLAAGSYHRFDRLDLPIKQQGNTPRLPLKIGEGAWIGAQATVMAEVGAHAIVGAGAVVTRPVPPYAIVAGNPARVLRMRDNLPHKSEGGAHG